ncbi:MAG: PEGA domain-containing protein [Phycisphaerae bacterium]|jgi:hypothetical protein
MRKLTGLALAGLMLAASGCLERQMTITSDPPGAMVVVSDVEKGRTPVTFPFTWYGDYDIIVRLEGHQTLKTHANINAPAYAIPPFDLLSELAPWTYRDRRYLDFKLNKAVAPTNEQLIERAREFREETQLPVRK